MRVPRLFQNYCRLHSQLRVREQAYLPVRVIQREVLLKYTQGLAFKVVGFRSQFQFVSDALLPKVFGLHKFGAPPSVETQLEM